MNARTLLPAAAFALAALALPAQEGGAWRAQSSTAHGVTGDIAITDTRIVLNFTGYTLAEIRSLQPDEIKATFSEITPSAEGTGKLFRTEIPGNKRFAHKNTLCGGEEVQWVVAYTAGKQLQLAMFSGAAMPKLTAEALADTTSLCGTYAYMR